MPTTRRDFVASLLIIPLTACSSPEAANDLRARAVRALRGQVGWISDERTSVAKVATSVLHNWEVVDATLATGTHPRRVIAGIPVSEGTGYILSGQPANFSNLLTDDQVKLDKPPLALDAGRLFLDTTLGFVGLNYRIDSPANVRWTPQASAAAKKAFTEAWKGKIVKPTPQKVGSAHKLRLWSMHDNELYSHDLMVGFDGHVSDSAAVQAAGLPTQVGL